MPTNQLDPSAPQQRPHKVVKIIKSILAVLGVLFILNIFVSLFLMAAKLPQDAVLAGNKLEKVIVRRGNMSNAIVMIDLSGLIEPGELTRGSNVSDFLNKLELLQYERNLKAIIVVIDSPGGGATTTDIIHNQLSKITVPKVALLQGIAASGGYYIAAGCDRIIAHPTTITGSIGVIIQFPQVHKLFSNIGVDMITLKSGSYKDMLSPYRQARPEELKIMQSTVDDIYSQFINVVAEGRKMDTEKVRALADGRIFTAREALKLGLIDAIGYKDDAIKRAEELAQVTDAVVYSYIPRKGFFDIFHAQQTSANPLAVAEQYLQVHGAMYLYTGP